MFTYNLIRTIAWLSFIAGVITAGYGLTSADASIGVYITICGVVGGAASGGLFLFFAKILEQNDEQYEQNEKLLKLLNEIDTNTRRGRYNA